jgi:hypothetical protein
LNGEYFHSKLTLTNYLAGYRAFFIDWFTSEETDGLGKIISRIEDLLLALEKLE